MGLGLEASKIIGTGTVGAAIGFATNAAHTRGAARTAARLIFAELVVNSASTRYYRRSHRLLQPGTHHVAWDNNSVTLARMRGVKAFQTINAGYQALEAIAFIAGSSPSDEPVPADLADILEDAIERVVDALEECGRVAQIEQAALDGFLTSLDAESRDIPAVPPGGPAVLRSVGILAPLVIFSLDREHEDAKAIQTAAATPLAPLEGTAASVVVAPRGVRRLVLDAMGGDALAMATPRRREGEPATGDLAVDEAYDGLGVAYQLFKEVFGRDSIDGNGMELVAVVHYGQAFANAFWSGELFVFGDGDGHILLRSTAGLDVIGHEFAIGALQFAAGIRNSGQSGSILQSLADVFGVLTKQFHLKQPAADADWLIGKEIAGPAIGKALRSMKEPGTANKHDNQPATMDGFVDLPDDNSPANDSGGIHTNSGILNRAFYLSAIAIGGFAWERAGKIWYETMIDPSLKRDPTFTGFAGATCRAARRLYGEAGPELPAISKAWAEVGVAPAEDPPPRRRRSRGTVQRTS